MFVDALFDDYFVIRAPDLGLRFTLPILDLRFEPCVVATLAMAALWTPYGRELEHLAQSQQSFMLKAHPTARAVGRRPTTDAAAILPAQ